MSKLKVKAASLPARCDVCHQSDQFDRERGYCERCQHASYYRKREDQQLVWQVQEQTGEATPNEPLPIFVIVIMFGFVGIFAGFILGGFIGSILLGTLLPLFGGGLIKFLLWFKDLPSEG
jgi:hypothetical protein